jgi:hypothetical protein
MTIPVSVYVATGVGTVAATAAQSLDPTAALLWTAAVCGALAAIWRFFGITNAWRAWRARVIRQRTFYLDWYGEPARPGVEPRPGVPEQVAYLGKQMHEIKGRDTQLAEGLQELTRWSRENGQKLDRLDERVIAADTRITDHRRRNEEQARVLRDDLEARANALEMSLEARNRKVDERLDTISDDLLRAETMRAALLELGIDVERPG